MASAIMPPASNSANQAPASPARKNLKRPAPVSAGPTSTPIIPSIKTPGLSARSPGLPSDKMLPSQLPRSPASPWSTASIKNEDMKTPITPPSAYSDFLTALSPAMSTPATARSAFSSFSFTDRTGHLTPITQPPSAASFAGNSANESKRRAPPPAFPTAREPAPAAVSAPLVPPSPFVRPNIMRRSSSKSSINTLHKLQIPDSPSFSPITESAGNSAITKTPASAHPLSANPARSARALAEPISANVELRSPFSPTSWYQEGRTRQIIEPPKSAASMQTVSVKQVVTRTVTYTRARAAPSTPLEPAPKRRRRAAPGEAATPIDPRMMPFSERRGKKAKADDAKKEETISDLSEESISSSGASDSEESQNLEDETTQAPVVKVEAPAPDEEKK